MKRISFILNLILFKKKMFSIRKGIEIIKSFNDSWLENEIEFALEKNILKNIINKSDRMTPLSYECHKDKVSIDIINYLVYIFKLIK
jgi:hypothetical protein